MVQVLGDADPEANETMTLTLSNPTDSSLARAQATGTITNDDVAPSAATCSPRPNVSVTTQAVGGQQMQVTVKADFSNPNETNTLQSIQFGAPTNATIQMVGQSSIGTG